MIGGTVSIGNWKGIGSIALAYEAEVMNCAPRCERLDGDPILQMLRGGRLA